MQTISIVSDHQCYMATMKTIYCEYQNCLFLFNIHSHFHIQSY